MVAAVETGMPTSPMAARAMRRSRGFSLLETVLSMGIAASALGGFMQLQSDASERTRALAAASRVTQIAAAAGDYLKVYSANLMADIPAGGSAVIPVAMAVAGGTVPTGPYGLPSLGQNTAVIVKHVAASGVTPAHLEALVTTYGGQPIRDAYLSVASGKIGAAGGTVLAKPPPGTAANTVQGAYGGWQSAAAAWSSGLQTPSAGHVQASLTFSNQGTGLSDYLDRYNTGVAEANRLHTSIDANANSLNNVTGIGGGTAGPLTVGNYNSSGTLVSSSDLAVSGSAAVTGNAAVAGHGTLGGTVASTDCGTECGLTVTGGVEIRSDWLRMVGSGGIYWQNWGGGLYMSDQTWIRTFNNKGLYSSYGVEAPTYWDATNPGYYLQPANTARLNYVDADNIDSGGFSRAASYMASPTYYDSRNYGYYVQPSATSNMNTVNASVFNSGSTNIDGWGFYGGNMVLFGSAGIDGSLIVTTLGVTGNSVTAGSTTSNGVITGNGGVATELVSYPGWGCSPSGLMAVSATDWGLLFCRAGTWVEMLHQ